MEGTVTISLQDYEKLIKSITDLQNTIIEREKKYYFLNEELLDLKEKYCGLLPRRNTSIR